MLKYKSIYKKNGISALVFATGMLAWDYFDDESFKPVKFIFHFLFFFGATSIVDIYRAKKKG